MSVKYLFNICVSELVMDRDAINYLNIHIYKTILWNCLNKLSLSFNKIQYVAFETSFAFLTLPRLREINACCNFRLPNIKLYNINRRQGYKKISININLPRSLMELDISYNYIHNQRPIRWDLLVTFSGENLRKLNLQKTNFPVEYKDIFNFP